MDFIAMLDEIAKIKIAQVKASGAPISKIPIAKLLPWVAAASVGGAGVLAGQEAKETWSLGRQMRKAQQQQMRGY